MWPETECLQLDFHTERGVFFQGAYSIAEKRLHADLVFGGNLVYTSFPCRMKTALECWQIIPPGGD